VLPGFANQRIEIGDQMSADAVHVDQLKDVPRLLARFVWTCADRG
jgi:hypothetical protein